MKKRQILCALSDQRVIPDLNRLEQQSDVSYAPNSEHAIQALGLNDFDAVVTDFKPDPSFELPFLARVMNRFPNVIRMMIINLLGKPAITTDGTANQYLTTPCQSEVLISAIDRAQLMSTWFRDAAMKPLLAQMKKLPTVPAIYMRVMKELQSDSADLNAVGAIISEDFNLTVRVLQMVNSAACGLGRTVSSPVEAIHFLGVERIKGLVLMAGLSRGELAKDSPLCVEALWAHSIQVAKISRAVVKAAGKPELAEESFTAGLLHDVGKLLLAVNIPERYNPILKRSGAEKLPLHVIEKEVLGVTHEQIGACILGTWGLPGSIIAGLAFHHYPERLGVEGFQVTTAVHIANAFAHGWTRKNSAVDLDVNYLRELGITTQLDSWQQQFGNGS